MDWYSFFSHGFFSVSFVFFFVIFFSKIIFVDFIFLILSWLEFNFVTKLNYMGKHCGLLQYLSLRFFFLMIFFKIIFVHFIFLILSWLRLQLQVIANKAKSCGEALYLSSQNTVNCYSVSNIVFFPCFFFQRGREPLFSCLRGRSLRKSTCVFFGIFFSKIIYIDFNFLILSWLRI